VMKERGVLPEHLRFQVSIPMVNSVLPPRIFPNKEDLDRIRPGYAEATRAEIARIVEKIPPRELAIQWDCSTEVQDAYGAIPGFPLEGAIERNLDQVRALSPDISPDVALGYHFCFGTLGGWLRFAPDDLGQAVKLANAVIEASGRRVDWIHIPVLKGFTLRCGTSKRMAPGSIWARSITWPVSRNALRWRESICPSSAWALTAASVDVPLRSSAKSSPTI
jgi:hypothetical protein